MSIVGMCGFESGHATFEFSTASGTYSIQNTTKRSGTYALRVDPTTTNTGFLALAGFDAVGFVANLNLADLYSSFYFRVDTLPASGSEEIAHYQGVGNVRKFTLRITDAGKLQAYDSTGTAQLGSDSTLALSTGTWYRIAARVGTGASAPYSVAIYNDPGDGVAETLLDNTLAGTGDLNTANNLRYFLGKNVNRNGNSVNFYYDDVLTDNAADPGSCRILNRLPIANGSTMSWTDGPGADDHTVVDEVPPSGADYVMSPLTGNPNVALFTFQSCSTLSINALSTFRAQLLMTVSREDTSVTSSNQVRVKSGATTQDGSANNSGTAEAARYWLTTADPNTGSAWLQSGIDASEGGMVENNAVAMRLTACYMFVAFLAPIGGSVDEDYVVPSLFKQTPFETPNVVVFS
jgi:hypothetical protein